MLLGNIKIVDISQFNILIIFKFVNETFCYQPYNYPEYQIIGQKF